MQTLKVNLTVYLTERQEFASVISDTSQLLGHMNGSALTKRLEAKAGGSYLRASRTNELLFEKKWGEEGLWIAIEITFPWLGQIYFHFKGCTTFPCHVMTSFCLVCWDHTRTWA